MTVRHAMAEQDIPVLVTAARQGDPAAVDELLTRHLPLLHNVIGRALAGHPDVDDVVQETLIHAVDGLPGLRDPERFRAWLITIAIRQVKIWARARRRTAERQLPLETYAEPADPGTDVAEQVTEQAERAAERHNFRSAARWMTPDDRRVLALWWQELNGGLTRTEVADALEISVAHAGVRIHRMRAALARAHAVLTAYAARPRCQGLTAVAHGWDGTADTRRLARMARHVRGCPDCLAAAGALFPPEYHVVGIGLLATPMALPALGQAATGAVGWLHKLAATWSFKPVAVAVPTAGAVAALAIVLTPWHGDPGDLPAALPQAPAPIIQTRAPQALPSAPAASTSAAASAAPAAPPAARKLYVSRDGSDAAAGSEAKPLRTVNEAVAVAEPGDTIYLRGGFHKMTGPVQITTNGTADRPITLTAYPGEKPSMDAGSVAGSGPFITHRADYWVVRGLDIYDGKGVGYQCEGCAHNIFENLNIHDNAGSGFVVRGGGAAANQIVNSDFFTNVGTSGAAADGLTFAAGSGAGNLVRGCRTFDNVDDGIAVEGFAGPITIDASWSFRNGKARPGGTGNGFDVGGTTGSTVTRSAAWKNEGSGFTGAGATATRNSSFRNVVDGFRFTETATLRNNFANGNEEDHPLPPGGEASGNSWDEAGWTIDVIRSVDATVAEGDRPADGTQPSSDYLKNTKDAGIGAPMIPVH